MKLSFDFGLVGTIVLCAIYHAHQPIFIIT